MNWNSKDKSWNNLVSDEVKSKKDLAVKMKSEGMSHLDIANALKLSKSRVYELLKSIKNNLK